MGCRDRRERIKEDGREVLDLTGDSSHVELDQAGSPRVSALAGIVFDDIARNTEKFDRIRKKEKKVNEKKEKKLTKDCNTTKKRKLLDFSALRRERQERELVEHTRAARLVG